MNGRQAAKKAGKLIQEMGYIIAMQSQDINDYNAAVLDMIAGKSPCWWCEENRLGECKHKDSWMSAGCSEWWLRYRVPKTEGGDSDGEAQAAEDSVLDLEKQ